MDGIYFALTGEFDRFKVAFEKAVNMNCSYHWFKCIIQPKNLYKYIYIKQTLALQNTCTLATE